MRGFKSRPRQIPSSSHGLFGRIAQRQSARLQFVWSRVRFTLRPFFSHFVSLADARLAQSAERKTLNLVVVGSSPTVGILSTIGVVVSWVVAIDSTRVRFPDGAERDHFMPNPPDPFSNSEVKRHRARLVVRWGTTREVLVLRSSYFFLSLFQLCSNCAGH